MVPHYVPHVPHLWYITWTVSGDIWDTEPGLLNDLLHDLNTPVAPLPAKEQFEPGTIGIIEIIGTGKL